MTQRRPTEQEVGQTLQQLWRLAHADTTGYRLVAEIVDRHLHVRDLLAQAEHDAAYGPGPGGGVAALGTQDASPVEARLHWPDTAHLDDPHDRAEAIRRYGRQNDRLVAAYLQLARQFLRELRGLADRMYDGINQAEQRADTDREAG